MAWASFSTDGGSFWISGVFKHHPIRATFRSHINLYPWLLIWPHNSGHQLLQFNNSNYLEYLNHIPLMYGSN